MLTTCSFLIKAKICLVVVIASLLHSTLSSPIPSPEADPMTGVEMYVGTMMAAALLAKGDHIQ